mmetsp:Transcript_120670/g.341878  ORF Transcript_120670/g.341878 Transcript_120670/m.341878 type:complete len:329 (-) Transcript_120670:66-1052(-)
MASMGEVSICLHSGTVRVLRGSRASRREALGVAVKAFGLGPEQQLEHADGYATTKRALYLKCLELDPSWSLPYHNLAATMRPQERILLPRDDSQREWTRRELYVQALGLEHPHSRSYSSLAALLGPGESVRLPDGASLGAAPLCLRALELDRRSAHALAGLGAVLGPDERVALADGTEWGQVELLHEALRVDGATAQAYCGLGLRAGLQEPRELQLPDGEIWSCRDLYLRAIELDPGMAAAYRGLAGTLATPADYVRLADGGAVTGRELLTRATFIERWGWKPQEHLAASWWEPLGHDPQKRWLSTTGELWPTLPPPPPVERIQLKRP